MIAAQARAITRRSIWRRRKGGTTVVVVDVRETQVQLHDVQQDRLWWLGRAEFLTRYQPADGPAPVPTDLPDVPVKVRTPRARAKAAPPECGTLPGYRQHLADRTEPCEPCYEANRTKPTRRDPDNGRPLKDINHDEPHLARRQHTYRDDEACTYPGCTWPGPRAEREAR